MGGAGLREKRIFRGESFYHIKQCFKGGCTGGRYGAEERQTTGWLGTCRNTFPYQTTNIDGGGVPRGAVVGTEV